MITGHDDAESVTESYEMGASDFVAKPVNWLVLMQRVLSLLRASRTLDELQDSRRQLARAQAAPTDTRCRVSGKSPAVPF